MKIVSHLSCRTSAIFKYFCPLIVISFLLQEIQCLQDNYEDLRDECQDAIGNFTEDEDEDIELDTILMRACTPMIKKFCAVCIVKPVLS